MQGTKIWPDLRNLSGIPCGRRYIIPLYNSLLIRRSRLLYYFLKPTRRWPCMHMNLPSNVCHARYNDITGASARDKPARSADYIFGCATVSKPSCQVSLIRVPFHTSCTNKNWPRNCKCGKTIAVCHATPSALTLLCPLPLLSMNLMVIFSMQSNLPAFFSAHTLIFLHRLLLFLHGTARAGIVFFFCFYLAWGGALLWNF